MAQLRVPATGPAGRRPAASVDRALRLAPAQGQDERTAEALAQQLERADASTRAGSRATRLPPGATGPPAETPAGKPGGPSSGDPSAGAVASGGLVGAGARSGGLVGAGARSGAVGAAAGRGAAGLPLTSAPAAAAVRAAQRQPGTPLTDAQRAFFQPRLGLDLSGVRLHSDAAAAASARALGTRAYALGTDVMLDPERAPPDSRAGRRVLAHELAHIGQHLHALDRTARDDTIHRDNGPDAGTGSATDAASGGSANAPGGTSSGTTSAGAARGTTSGAASPDALAGPVCEPRVGTFVLDPALANVQVPPQMSVHVKVQGFAPGSTRATEHHVVLDRQVISAQRVQVFLTPVELVFSTWMEAQATPPMSIPEPLQSDPAALLRPPRRIDPNEPAFTASGAIQVLEQRGTHVVTAAANTETTAAATVVLVDTDAGHVLLDAGLQCLVPGDAQAVGEAMRDRLAGLLGTTAVNEAVLMPGPPAGHLLPYIASKVGIVSVRATADQLADGSVNAVLAAQSAYREWYERARRDQLEAGRAAWEGTQPLAPNQDVRDQRWARHVQAELAADPVLAGPTVNLAANAGAPGAAILDEPTKTAAAPQRDAAGVLDLTGTAWEPDTDAGQIIVFGDGRLTTFPAQGFVLRPAAAPAHAPVPGLQASGPQGLAPAAPRAVTPWLALPAVSKEGLTLARLDTGHAMLVDAGGAPRAVAMSAVAQMQTQLGVTNVQQIVITHVHADHVRHLVRLIKAYDIPASRLATSSAWTQAKGLQELSTTTDPDLLRLGYGAAWRPTVAVAGTGVQHTRIGSGVSTVDLYARASAHQALDAAYTARAAGGAKVASHVEDSASFLIVHGNESSPARHAVFGDFRGEDIAAMRNDLGAEGFADALRNVRVVSGLGHHLSAAAGRTPADIEGMNLLLEQTIQRTGELTLLVQSKESFAFKGPATRAGPEGALLNYLQRQGVRVVFAGQPTGTAGTDTATLDSSRGLSAPPPGPGGTGVQVFDADAPLQAAYRRLNLLREALRTVAESPSFAGQALGQPERSAPELTTALNADIARLESLLAELRGMAAADLLDARGVKPGGSDYTSAADRAAFRSRMVAPGRTADAILVDLAQVRPAEAALSPDVRARLQAALDHGRPIVLSVAFAAMPRALAEAAEALPVPERDALARQYRELSELTTALETGQVPPDRRVEVLARATALRDQLRQWQGTANEAQRGAIAPELARVEGVVDTLKAQARSDVLTGRDPQGRLTRTEFLRMPATGGPAGADAAVRGFHGIGQAMGAVMVLHSVQEAAGTAARAMEGQATVPETALRAAHSAYGMHMGVRMATTSLRQAAAGAGHVAPWEFGVLAVLEFGAAATADYKTAEERNAAMAGSAIHASVNLLCMMVGQSIMQSGAAIPAASPPSLLAKVGVMGFGLAVTLAGQKILGWLGLDEAVQRWASYPPGSVTEVHQKIGRVLGDYRALVGNRRLQQRSDTELGQLGIRDTGALRRSADADAQTLRADLSAKESELTGLFEEAYGDARGAWVGLPMLDQQAAEFTRLRAEARGSDADPARAGLDARWRALDAKLDMRGSAPGEIVRLRQWATLDEELDTVDEGLHPGAGKSIDHAKLFTHLDRVHLTLENARYRLDPAPRGGLRTTPMLPADSPGHATYVTMLREREQRMARLQGCLMAEAGQALPTTGVPADAEIDPRAAYARLRAVRAGYDAKVAAAAAQLPRLGSPATWAEPATLSRAVEDANNQHESVFVQLRMAEAALQASAAQASASITVQQPAAQNFIGPPAPGNETPANLRESIRAETTGAQQAMEERRMRHGLVFRHELDALLEHLGAQEDKLLAAQIDAAQAAPGTTQPRPLTDEEIAALRRGELAAQGGRLSSTEHQLARQRAAMAPMRSTSGIPDPVRDHRNVARDFARVNNPYRWYDDGIFDSCPEARYADGLHPVVAVAGGSRLGSKSFFGGPAWYHTVIAVNADAVTALGPNPIQIRQADLPRVSIEEITGATKP